MPFEESLTNHYGTIPHVSAPQPLSASDRPTITLADNGSIMHGARCARVVLRRDMIRVGCLSISIDAARLIMARHEQAFQDHEVLMQAEE